MSYVLLVIDDEANLRKGIRYGLSGKVFDVIEAENGKKGLEVLAQKEVDLVITDLKMPVMDGLTFLSECKKAHFNIPVIVLTAYGTAETAVQAMKSGAVDFLIKPFPLAELEQKISAILESKATPEETEEGFLGKSSAMDDVRNLCCKFAKAPSPVLISGSSGTGKEVTARYIHEVSGRKGKIIAINCGALPENLLESELFGYKKGAFTGASRDNPGFFSEASNGSLLLDEIGEITPRMQVALLRVIQEGEYIPLGSNKAEKTSARIIAATNRDLSAMVKEGSFREDLYYRLKVLEINLPDLKERGDDILLLADHFLARYSRDADRDIKGFSQGAVNALMSYSFPGNIRELGNIVERSVWISEGTEITEKDLGIESQAMVSNDSGRMEFKDRIENFERKLILDAVEKHGSNKSRLAEHLGLNRTALLYKLKKYKILIDS